MTTAATRLHLALARAMRALPYFRGKGRMMWHLRRRLLPGLPPSHAVHSVHMRDGSRMTLDVRSDVEWCAFYTGRYDDVLPAILDLLPERCLALDVGANIGFYTVPMGIRLRQLGGKCVAFEPVPTNYARLCDNIRANGLDDVVQALPLALGEQNRDIVMLLYDDTGATTGNAAWVASADFDHSERKPKRVVARMARLDDCVNQVEFFRLPCRFIKVDIEGNEPFFFRGAAGFLKENRPIVLAEVNSVWLARNALRASDYFEIFGPEGYTAYLWQHGAWLELSGPQAMNSIKGISTALLVPPDISFPRLQRFRDR
jgi:FkbM family methyltransferase